MESKIALPGVGNFARWPIVRRGVAVACLLVPPFCQSEISVYVIGGNDAPESSYPWMGALIRSDYDDLAEDQYCGCVLIDSNWVVTAAHCVDDRELDEFVIALGDENLKGSPRIIKPMTILVNSARYQRTSRGGDIALIQLAQPIADIDPIEYRRRSDGRDLPDNGRIIGWGRAGETDDGEPIRPEILQVADVPIYPYLDPFIVENWRREYLPEFIATGSLEPRRGASSGDSGGPLLIPGESENEWIVAGIDSWGASSSSDNAPLSMFTDVSFYSDWIDEIVGRNKWNNPLPVGSVFDMIEFDEQSEYGVPGLRFWPFSSGDLRRLEFSFDLRNWQAADLNLRNFPSYRINDDGSFFFFPNDALGSEQRVYYRFSKGDSPVPRTGPFPLSPYQITRGKNAQVEQAFGQRRTLFKLTNFEPGRFYVLNATRNDEFPFSFDVYEQTGSEMTPVVDRFQSIGSANRLFAVKEGSDYWMDFFVAGEGYGFEVYFHEQARNTVEPDVWHEGALSAGDSPFRREGVLMDSYRALFAFSGDVKIELESEFDAEMGVYDKDSGRKIAYHDQEAENELETFIVNGSVLERNFFRIFNFDHGIYGSYRFRYTDIEELRIVPVGTDEQRAVNASDRVNTNEDDADRYFEWIEIENPSSSSSITVSIEAHYVPLVTGIWDYNLDDYLESDFGEFTSHTFTPESDNRYIIYVSAPRGIGNVNYELRVTGEEAPENPPDDPIDEFAPELKGDRLSVAENQDRYSLSPEDYPPLPPDFRLD